MAALADGNSIKVKHWHEQSARDMCSVYMTSAGRLWAYGMQGRVQGGPEGGVEWNGTGLQG